MSPAISMDQRLNNMLDEHEIAGVLARWAHARDVADWETLAGCFHSDAMVQISWIHDTASEFIERSKGLAANRKPGMRSKHEITGPNLRLNGDRALGIIDVHLMMRSKVDDTEVDLQSWFHFFDRVEKRDGVWRILNHTAVYEQDRLDVVDPRGAPDGLFDDMDLSGYPNSCKFQQYFQRKVGRRPSDNVVCIHTPEEAELIRSGEAWLAEG
ncbi:MAG: nuclear transport factor 2 family protein [Rhodospirillales bacterium]|nr:nuclear transport factor 2 family protein [Rhodospirillales bacterium]